MDEPQGLPGGFSTIYRSRATAKRVPDICFCPPLELIAATQLRAHLASWLSSVPGLDRLSVDAAIADVQTVERIARFRW
jgi:hypothetical protein